MILVLVCYAAALLAAYRIASRLAQDTPLHLIGLTLLLFICGLSGAAAYAGFVGHLHPRGLVVAMTLLSGTAWIWGRKLPALPSACVTVARGSHGLGFAASLAMGLVLALAAMMIARQITLPPVTSSDAVWHYVPNIINLVQAGTLHHFEGISAYMPLAFEITFAWEIAFVGSLLLVPVLQSVVFIVGLIYMLLIADLGLKDLTVAVRRLGMVAAAIFWMGSQTIYDVFGGAGKNDLFYIVCGLAAAYYLLRHASIGRHLWLAALIGLFTGLAVAAKISGAPLIGILGLLYLFSTWRVVGARRLVKDVMWAGAAFMLGAAPWALRIVFQPGVMSEQAEVIAVGSANTIWHQWDAAVYQVSVPRWILPVALLIIGQLLLLWLRPGAAPRTKILPGALVVLGMLLLLDPQFDRHLGGLYGILAVVAVTLVTAAFQRQRLPKAALILMALVGAQLLLLVVVPYSAWIDEWSWSGDVFFGINYRYAGAAVPLFAAAQIILLAHALAVPTPSAAQPQPPHRVGWRVPGAVAFILLTLIGGRLLWGEMRYIITPPSLQAWLSELPAPAHIYAINVPPLSLYGPRLANRVDYVTAGHHGYFGDQAYRWSDVEALIEAADLDYVAVTFAYPVFIQARLLPTPEVLAEIAKMREHLTVVYEDEQVTLFATGRS